MVIEDDMEEGEIPVASVGEAGMPDKGSGGERVGGVGGDGERGKAEVVGACLCVG